MSLQENFKPVRSLHDKGVRVQLNLDSHQHTFTINANNLRSLARFYGFADVKILPAGIKEGKSDITVEVSSSIRNLTPQNFPPKAQWQAINIYINLPLIQEHFKHDYTDQHLSSHVESLIKQELKREGEKTLKKIHLTEAIVKDLFIPVLLTCIFIGSAKVEDKEFTEVGLLVLYITCNLLKSLVSNLETALLYTEGVYGFKPTLLDSTQAPKMLFSKLKVHTTKLLKLEKITHPQ